MDKEILNQIYDVLVAECGATEWMREQFQYAYSNGRRCTEFRFMGELGFGGKIYDDGPQSIPRFRVRCYPEDRTPEREEMCRRADVLLKVIDESMKVNA